MLLKQFCRLIFCASNHRTQGRMRSYVANFTQLSRASQCNMLNYIPNVKYANLPKLLGDVPPKMEIVLETMDDLTEQDLRRLKVIKLEYDVWQEMGQQLPIDVTDAMWLQLLRCESLNKRRKLYRYFASVESARRADKRKREIRRLEREQNGPKDPAPRNTFYFYIRESMMNVVENSRVSQAMMFELPLIIDLDYEHYMREPECKNLINQILYAHGHNKNLLSPTHFLLTGAKKGILMNAFHKAATTTQPLEDYMFTITQKSYLDIYPRDKLVYLSPNAPNIMRRFDHDKVYIIGGFVDKNYPKPMSMARAKEQGIHMERLPIDNFLRWSCGTKSLTVDQMVCILTELKNTGDWEKAFRFIPIRKLVAGDTAEKTRWGSYSDSPIVTRHST